MKAKKQCRSVGKFTLVKIRISSLFIKGQATLMTMSQAMISKYIALKLSMLYVVNGSAALLSEKMEIFK